MRQEQTQGGRTTIENACSIPVTQDYGLSVGKVVPI